LKRGADVSRLILLRSRGIERPSTVAATDETFKKAPESKKKHGEQSALGF
jgi:hypothetical protein